MATARSRSSTTSSTSTSGTCSSCIWSADQAFLLWPLRGHARSHRYITGFETGAGPVGPGVPVLASSRARPLPQVHHRF
ncbi:hypothetical protein DMX12_17280 [Pseudomonas sp. MB-090624]|nr:hypothetical protein DMX12_17280 [Pseudomonas sp. MB-090624]